ncbi:hypothetical protein C8J56DRAFT_805566 [Mycena floridula]|nr:hypothetical protein C8J56DRAFT_805566 [Mycena floridula]
MKHESTGRAFVINTLNIHRLVIAGVVVASKGLSDVFYISDRSSLLVGSIPRSEIDRLEVEFPLLNDFRLVIPKNEMQRYAEQLIAFSPMESSKPA